MLRTLPARTAQKLTHFTSRLGAHTAHGMSSAGKKRQLSSAAGPQKKRKADPNLQKYYAVRAGMRPGVYLTWDECQAQTTGYKGASCEFPLLSFPPFYISPSHFFSQSLGGETVLPPFITSSSVERN